MGCGQLAACVMLAHTEPWLECPTAHKPAVGDTQLPTTRTVIPFTALWFFFFPRLPASFLHQPHLSHVPLIAGYKEPFAPWFLTECPSIARVRFSWVLAGRQITTSLPQNHWEEGEETVKKAPLLHHTLVNMTVRSSFRLGILRLYGKKHNSKVKWLVQDYPASWQQPVT